MSQIKNQKILDLYFKRRMEVEEQAEYLVSGKTFSKLDLLKEEIEALLDGCDTYEQEMIILHSYNIVSFNPHYVKMNEIKTNKTNKTN